MLIFITAVAVVLVVSFLCSIFESVLLSVGRPRVESLVQQGRRAGRLMAGFKDNIDVPIAAILILNTAAHTVGASVAGASCLPRSFLKPSASPMPTGLLRRSHSESTRWFACCGRRYGRLRSCPGRCAAISASP